MKKKAWGACFLLSGAASAALVGLSFPLPVWAQQQTYLFDIPPQEVGAALRTFARVSRQQVAFQEEAVQGKRTAAVKGDLTPRNALMQLLDGSGLAVESRKSGLFIVKDPSSGPPSRSEGAQEDTASAQLDEVVVTAQKRAERLLDVPQSMSVVTAEHMKRVNALQLRDFADTVPGLSIQTEGAGSTQISMRGVTSGKDASATVGIYVDDVPYGPSTGFGASSQVALDAGLFDMDRVEVLRGPQGTLYGASTMGGLLKYVTTPPNATDFGMDVRTGLAQTRSGEVGYHASATVNTPIITDRLALRTTGFYSKDAGYIDNLDLGREDVNGSAIYGGRTDLLFTPNEALSVRVTGFAQNISRDGWPIADYTLVGSQPGGIPRPVDGNLDQAHLIPEFFKHRFRLVSGTVAYNFGSMTLTSISSNQNLQRDFTADLSDRLLPGLMSLGPFSAVGTWNQLTTNKFTQEVRLVSDSSGKVEWLVGGFFTNEVSEEHSEFVFLNPARQIAPNNLYTVWLPTRYKEYAGFGDLTVKLTERFDVTGGVRYAHNSQDFRQVGSGALALSAPSNESSESVFTYLVNSRYHFNEQAMGYVRYATGYRPGGPNYIILDPATGLNLGEPSFDADRLKSYEIGYKVETEGRRYGLDVAAYYIDWSDIQITVSRNGFSNRDNAAGGATVQGAELTLTARPVREFTMTGAFAYQDAKLSRAEPALSGAKGERLPTVPRATVALNADYQIAATNFRPMVGATARYIGERTGAFGPTAYRLPDYTTLDLRAGFELKQLQVQLYARNVFDERGLSVPRVLGYSSPSVTFPISVLQPRTFGLALSTQF
jgi:iron complex outermembrane receptor protein